MIKKYGIPIRSCSERTYVKLNPGGDPFNPRVPRTPREQELFLSGLIIYWAEGSRKIRYSVQVVNTDHRVLVLFLRFLREIVRVDERRLRVDVRVFHGFDKNKARRYWSRVLHLAMKQVNVYPPIDRRSDPTKQGSPYGIATVCISNTKLNVGLDQQLEENIERLMGRWSRSAPAGQRGGYGVVREEIATYTYA